MSQSQSISKNKAILSVTLFSLVTIFFCSLLFEVDHNNDNPVEEKFGAVGHVTAPENNVFKMGVNNFQFEVKNLATDPEAMKYIDETGYFAFTPKDIGSNNIQNKTAAKDIQNRSAKFEDVFSPGIDVGINAGTRKFSKIVQLDSIKDIKRYYNKDSEFIEISFDVKTDLVVDGLGDNITLEVTKPLRIGDKSYLQPAFAWDSTNEVKTEVYDECTDPDWNGGGNCESYSYDVSVDNKINIRSTISQDNEGNITFTKYIPVSWLETAQFPVYTDADITYGTEQEFWADDTDLIGVVTLESDTFVVCWSDDDDSTNPERGLCKVATVSGTTMSFGTESEFAADAQRSLSFISSATTPCRLDSNSFVVTYIDDDLLDDGYIRAANYSGNTISSWGTAVEFETDDAEFIRCESPADDEIFLTYNDETGGTGDVGTAVICTASGTTISCGTPAVWDGSNDFDPATIDSALIGDHKYAFCFEADDFTSPIGDPGLCIAASSTGTTLEFGSYAVITDKPLNAGATACAADSIETDKFVGMCSGNTSADNGLYVTLCEVSGLTLSCGDDYSVYNLSNSLYNDLHFNDTDELFAFWTGNLTATATGTSLKMTDLNYTTGTLSSSTPDFFAEYDINNGDMEADKLTTDTFVICWTDDADVDDPGKCIIGEVVGGGGGAAPVFESFWDDDF